MWGRATDPVTVVGMSRARPAVLSVAAALVLASCSGSSGDPTSTSSSSSGASASSSGGSASATPAAYTPEPEEKEAMVIKGDDFPSIDTKAPLPAGVTESQLKTWVDDGTLPVARTHGVYFETMINSITQAKETPDVVLFGDSMTQQGVDPQVLGKGLSEAKGSEVTVFNAASSRARWAVNRMVAEYLVEQDKVPDVAVLMLSTRAAEDDGFYDEEVQKTGFSAVVQGCDRPRATTWTAADAKNCRRYESDLRYRFRDAGGQVARAQSGEKPQTSIAIGSKGFLRSDGFMIHPAMSLAEVQKTSDERMKRGNPGLPHMDEQAAKDFAATAQLLRDHGATVISSTLPYNPPHQKNLEKAYPGYDTRRQQAAEEITAQADVPLYPIDEMGSWFGDGSGRDAIHLAPPGAADFSRQMVQDTPGFADAVVDAVE